VLDRGVAFLDRTRLGVADLHQRLAVALLGRGHALVECLHGGGVAFRQRGGIEGQQEKESGGGRGGPADQSDDKGGHGGARSSARSSAQGSFAAQSAATARVGQARSLESGASSARASRWTPS